MQFLYIINGCLEVDKVDHKYVLEKGDMYIINSEDIHKIKTISEDNIILIANINEARVKELHGGLYGDMFRVRYIKNIVDIDYICNNTYIEDKQEAVQILKEYLLRSYVINRLYTECIIALIFTWQVAGVFIKSDNSILDYAVPNIRIGIMFAAFGAQQ